MAEIALAGLPLDYPYSGTATYIRGLLSSLPEAAPDLALRVVLRNAEAIQCRDDARGRVAVRRLTTPLARFDRGSGAGARADKWTWEVIALPLEAAMRRSSVLHYPYFAAPPVARRPVVVTVHDLVPLVLPGYHRTRQSALYGRFMAATVRRAAAVITVSEHSRRDIVRVLGISEERIAVTPAGVDERFRKPLPDGQVEMVAHHYGLPQRMLLYLGGAERRKNLEMLVQSWKLVAGRMAEREVHLVIVARFPPPDPLYPDIPGLVRELGLEDSICIVPSVREADKPAVYRRSLGFLFPSRYEGFGLPPLEAMASGVPVAAANSSSLPEVVGDAGLLLDPDDVAGWAEAMLRLVDTEGERERLAAAGRERAARFTWRRTAQGTAEVYRRVLAQ